MFFKRLKLSMSSAKNTAFSQTAMGEISMLENGVDAVSVKFTCSCLCRFFSVLL